MNWFKSALSPNTLAERNIRRYQSLKQKILDVKRLIFATQSGSHQLLEELANEKLVKANHDVADRLNFLLSGENNQRVVLDSPHRTSNILNEMILMIDGKVNYLRTKVQGLDGVRHAKSETTSQNGD